MKTWQGIGIALLTIILLGITVFFAVDGKSALNEKLTYVSSTEYITGDEGQVIVRLSNFRGQPVTTANCSDTVLYPNKTIFLNDAVMSLNVHDNYYHAFTVPPQDGVYETIVECDVSTRNITNAKTFHVSLFSSRLFSLFSDINGTMFDFHDTQMETYQNLSDAMIQGFTNTMVRINETYNNLTQDVSDFKTEVQANFTTVIELIDSMNYSIAQSENQSHEKILNYLDLINQTTISTQNQLTNFESTTQTNFETINITIQGIKQDTETIMGIIEQVNQTTTYHYTNLTNQISNLYSYVEENHNITQKNISQLKTMITNLSNDVKESYNSLNQTIYTFWNETNYNFAVLYDLTNLTEWEVSLILQYLNISTTDLTIYVEHNNCILGSTYIIDAEVRDYFNNILSDTAVWCNITTNFWGNASMTYTPSINKFRHTHTCSPEGIVVWAVECDWL